MKTTMKRTAAVVALAFAGIAGNAQAANLGGTDVKFSGYIKLDAMVSDYSEGSLGAQNLNRDFYIPSLTPVSGVEESAHFDAHARQSRFRFTTTTDTEEGDKITGVLEFDFLVTNNGNERISNSYTPRMRHAFLKYKNWTVGQTWSTFMDVGALPETVDFIGVTDATIFDRQPLVKYTNGAWEFALENPETTVTPNGGGGRIVADDNNVPDFVARYMSKQDWGYFKVAGLLRQIKYENGTDIDGSSSAWGVSLTGKVNLDGGDDIRVIFNTGSGLGRYIGLNAANGAVVTPDGDLEAIDSYGYAIAYRRL